MFLLVLVLDFASVTSVIVLLQFHSYFQDFLASMTKMMSFEKLSMKAWRQSLLPYLEDDFPGVPPSVLLLPGPLLSTHGGGVGTGDFVDDGGGSTDILLLGPEHLPGDDLGLRDDFNEEEEDFCFLITGPGEGPGCSGSGWPGAPGIASLLFFIGDPSKPSPPCRDFCPNWNGSWVLPNVPDSFPQPSYLY